MSIFAELKRRNVIRVAVAYLAMVWLLTEVASTLFPFFGVPDWGVRFIVVLFALGFVPSLIFSWVYELTPEGLKREQEVVRDKSITYLTAKRLDVITIGFVAIALAFILADRLWLQSRPVEPPSPAANQKAETARADAPGSDLPLDSIAVLPFANRSAKPDDAFFVDGIHDDLLTVISQIGPIKTISRTSVMKFRDSTKSIPEIAAELDVTTVLEGGVQRAGNQVRINVQLIDARSDNHLWSEIYDRELTAENVFAIQSEIAESIAIALRAVLTPEARERIDRVPTEDLQALEAYFRGRQKMATRVVADLATAVGHFKTAVELDPGFALAYAGLAEASALYRNYAGLMSEGWDDESRAAVTRALQLDAGLAEAHSAEGLRNWYLQEFEAAEAAFARALQLNPNYARAYQWYGKMLSSSNARLEEALEYSRKAAALDPKSAIILSDYGEVLNISGRINEALEQFRRAVAIEPRFSKGYRLMGGVAAGLGRMDEAISAFLKARAIEPDNWGISKAIGFHYLLLGEDKKAESWFKLAIEQAPRGEQQLDTELGRLYLFRGDRDRAMRHFVSALTSNPEDPVALYHLANFQMAEGNLAEALARYQQIFPGLLGSEPIVDSGNHVAAIHVAAMLSGAGQAVQAKRLLKLAAQHVESYVPRHYVDEAAIHALLGDDQTALDALRSMEYRERVYSWREVVVSHPAFQNFHENPAFQALDEEFKAEMAGQLTRVRELEASGKLAPLPKL